MPSRPVDQPVRTEGDEDPITRRILSDYEAQTAISAASTKRIALREIKRMVREGVPQKLPDLGSWLRFLALELRVAASVFDQEERDMFILYIGDLLREAGHRIAAAEGCAIPVISDYTKRATEDDYTRLASVAEGLLGKLEKAARKEAPQGDWLRDYEAMSYRECEIRTGISKSTLQEKWKKEKHEGKPICREENGQTYWLRSWADAHRKK